MAEDYTVVETVPEESVVEETGRKIGGIGLGAAAGGLIGAPIALAIGAALTPVTLGLSLPITAGLVGLGGWLGHKATQRKRKAHHLRAVRND